MKTILFGFVSVAFCHVSVAISYFYMDQYCGQNIDLDNYDQIRLKLTSRSSFEPDMNCQVTIGTAFSDQMMLYFKSLDIEKDFTCSSDYLEMHDGLSMGDPYIGGSRLCGNTPPNRVFTTSGRFLTMWFRSDSSQQYSGFDMVITSYHTGSCGSEEFNCNNGRCIDNSLKCNDYNSCGDNSDCKFTFTIGGITGAAVGGTVFILIIVIIAVVVCRRRRRRKLYQTPPTHTTYSSTSTTSYGYNQPASTQYSTAPPAYQGPASVTSYQEQQTIVSSDKQTE